MLEILPVKDKILQESICLQCGSTFDPSLMAYSAYSNGKPVGICQFSIEDGVGTLNDLSSNTSDAHMLYLIGCAVLNFIDLCGAHTVKCQNRNIDEALLCSIGFLKKTNELFEIDLFGDIS